MSQQSKRIAKALSYLNQSDFEIALASINLADRKIKNYMPRRTIEEIFEVTKEFQFQSEDERCRFAFTIAMIGDGVKCAMRPGG